MRTPRHSGNDAWEALLSAHAVLMKQFAAEDIWQDVSMREYDVLYTLSKCREPVRIGELNRHVLLSQPALSRLVDRLAERGIVERQSDPADGRGVRLSLTDAGRILQREVGRKHARSVARAMTDRLTPGELRELETICLKLARPAVPVPVPAAAAGRQPSAAPASSNGHQPPATAAAVNGRKQEREYAP